MSRYGGEDRGHYGGGGGQRGYHGGGGGGRRNGPPNEEAAAGGAFHLARIHGTEEDRVNCPFYFKIGACRHGDRCSRLHNKPVFSQTVLVTQLYDNPVAKVVRLNGNPATMNQQAVEEEFEDFYEELYEELSKYGPLEELHVCDNLGEHLLGNVYAKFADEEDAAMAQKGLYARFYAGQPMISEFSPVTDFRESRCRQYDDGTCNRGGYCNFMHLKKVRRAFLRDLEKLYKKQPVKSRSTSASRSKSPSPVRKRSRKSRSRSRDRDRRRRSSRSRERERRHSRSKDRERRRSRSKERRRSSKDGHRSGSKEGSERERDY